MYISEIVAKEYLDYIKKEVLESKIQKLVQTTESLNSLPYFKKIKLPNLDDRRLTVLSNYKQIIESPHFKIRQSYVDTNRLLAFLLENKQQKDSITDFLSINGYKIDFVTLEYLEQTLDYDLIIKDLFRHPTDILSYISPNFFHYAGRVRLLKKEVDYKRVDKFYTYIDPDDNQQKFLAHIILKPNIIFKVPSSFKPDLTKLTDFERAIAETTLETYDIQGNPVYNQEVLSLVGGTLDIENKKIIAQDIYDTFFDYYRGWYK